MECEALSSDIFLNIENFDPVALTYTRVVPAYRPRTILKDITPKPMPKRKDNILLKNAQCRKKVGGLR